MYLSIGTDLFCKIREFKMMDKVLNLAVSENQAPIACDSTSVELNALCLIN